MNGPTPEAVSLRILCADDDQMARQLVGMVLARNGHEVTCVTDGDEAWEALGARPGDFDVLVTDHDMPKLDGLALVARVRARGFAGPIVVVSGSIDDALAAKYRALEVDAILAKPFFAGQLITAVLRRQMR